MADIWVLVPLVAIGFTLGGIVLIVKYVFDYRSNVRRYQAEGGTEYRRLAEEAVSSQKALTEEVRRMNQTLAEIERVLKEV